MKHLALIAAWIALAIPLHTHASDALTVTLHRTDQPSTRGSIEILVVFTNHTDEPDYIYRPESPFGRDDQLPSSDFLKVFDSSGNPVRYVGARDHWGPIRDSHFVEIAPHESVSRVVNIADAYDFGNGGVFSIRYAAIKRNVSMARTSSNQARRLEQTDISSGELVIDVDGPGFASYRSAPSALLCTPEQNDVIFATVLKAKDRTFKAANIQYEMYKIHGAPGHTWYEFHPNKRFDRWFGMATATEPMPHDPDWHQSANYAAIQAVDATFNRLMRVIHFEPLKASCGCPGRPPEAIASAEDHNLYAITFCPGFFALPEDDPVKSRVGSVVHEMSHFYDHSADGRSDFGYGKRCAQDLAVQDKLTAVRNADNLEYFVMDTTPYDELRSGHRVDSLTSALPVSCRASGSP